MELQNNRVLTYEGCFGFHRVANAKESRLSARPEHTQHKYWRRYVALNVWLSKDVTLSCSLLFLAFATRRNPKHPSYVSTRFFCNSFITSEFLLVLLIWIFYSRTITFKKIFAKLKFSPALFEEIPSFVCLVFKIENKWTLKLQNLLS